MITRAFALYAGRPDKEWGLTDCVSFVVTQDRGITEALAANQHFLQAGFRALMRVTNSARYDDRRTASEDEPWPVL